MGIAAYRATIRETETPRQIEHRIFSRLTAELGRYRGVMDPYALTDEMKSAVWENQRFWQAMRADLVVPDNGLPRDVRATLLSIGGWVDAHSAKVLAAQATVDALIDVNENIMKGLASSRGVQDGKAL